MLLFDKSNLSKRYTMKILTFDQLQDRLETPEVLNLAIEANQYLAELKGVVKSIPNETILISTLSLQEAQDSSEIENIITTQDALLKYRLQGRAKDLAVKEVSNYADGLIAGYEQIRQTGLIRTNTILQIQEILEGNRAGFRKTPGTVLRNENTGETIYTPPSPEHLPQLMHDLQILIHDQKSTLNSLIKMAIIHHHFESIHPFYDGNGRTGRIINVLYLVKEGLLDSPVLYLSRYINQSKERYYEALQWVRESEDWQSWVCYILKGVALTAKHGIKFVSSINTLLREHKHHIRNGHRFYSQDLLNHIFKLPYTKAAFLEKDLNVSRTTALSYLDSLVTSGILEKAKLGREHYYFNSALVRLLFNPAPLSPTAS